MNQIRLIALLLRPSLLSISVCMGLALVGLGLINWAFVAQNILYDYFFSDYGIVTVLQRTPGGVDDYIQTAFLSSTVRDVVSFLFVFMISVVVYTALERSTGAYNGVIATLKDYRTLGPAAQKEIRSRAGFRAVIMLVWTMYALVFLRIFLPFCIYASRYGIAVLPEANGWLYCLMGLGIMLLCLHVHVIFARLMALRPRLFGGTDAVIAAEEK